MKDNSILIPHNPIYQRLTLINAIFLQQSPKERRGLSEALSALEKRNNTLVVWKLDRLGRSLGFLCELIERLKGRGTGFQSLTDGIDTTATGGKLVFHIMGALAEFERDLIRERTKAGMKAAKKRGKHVGREIRNQASS